MTDSVDIIKLDDASIIISIRYDNKQNTIPLSIPLQSIRMITVNRTHVRIFHGAKLVELNINENGVTAID